MSKSMNYDVIVIGGGSIGLSTAYHLSKRHARTAVLEQFTFMNQLGSSAGVSRQFRIPYPKPRFISTCLVALSKIPNKELIVDFAPDWVPNHENISVYATGWAGKFVPLLGLIMSQLALDGSTPFDISHFQMGSRFFQAL